MKSLSSPPDVICEVCKRILSPSTSLNKHKESSRCRYYSARAAFHNRGLAPTLFTVFLAGHDDVPVELGPPSAYRKRWDHHFYRESYIPAGISLVRDIADDLGMARYLEDRKALRMRVAEALLGGLPWEWREDEGRQRALHVWLKLNP